MGQAKKRGTYEQRRAAATDSPLTDTLTPETGLDILNVGAGHVEIRFDDKDPMEMERAKRIIEDMLKRGYALFMHGKDDALIRVKRFDKKKGVYLIADGPTVPAAAEPIDDPRVHPIAPEETDGGKRVKPVEREVKMSKAKVTVVGRSAGG